MLFFKGAGVSRIAVFLGNPGAKYDGTRHNAGFLAADYIEKEKKARFSRLRFNSLTTDCRFGEEKVLLIKPQTFMNLSGGAVAQAARFYKIGSESIIVIADDISLPPGKIRIRQGGSAGGHNGLKSIIEALGTEDFPRIKIGIGNPKPAGWDTAEWVLTAPEEGEAVLIRQAVARAAEALESYICDGPQAAMNKFN